MATFKQKTVYHGWLSRMGRMMMMFTSDTRDSTYPDGMPYVYFKVGGDETEYLYQIENASIRAQIDTLPQNHWLTVGFTGRAADATLQVFGDAAPSAGVGRTATAPAPSDTEAKTPAAPEPYVPPPMPSLIDTQWQALLAARELAGMYEHAFGEPLDDVTRALAQGLMISMERGRKLRDDSDPQEGNGGT